jgi:hypothetical protein
MTSNKYIAVAALSIPLLSSLARATSEEVNTSAQASTGFDDGTANPFAICVNESPNTGTVGQWGGSIGTSNCLKLYWQQAGYDGTRLKRGVEACSSLQSFKEGWWGFKFFLPSPGYPSDKTAAIAQLFQNGNCNSWCSLLNVVNGSLQIQYRNSCSTPTTVILVNSINYNSWNSFVLHFVASHENAGTIEIWYNGTVIYNVTGINFGFGTWSGDTLAAGNDITWAAGEYNYDDGHYTTGETRTMYFDNICELVGNPANAYSIASP